MEHPFFTTAAAATRAEALRWLSIAEKLLSARDLLGSKSFATRARESDSTLAPANEILAVLDTLIAGERRIGNNQPDLYSILRLTPQQGADPEVVAGQYTNLVVLLNPQNNRFTFAEQAFRLVIDAWSVLSNPSRKSFYDKEIGFYHHPPPQPDQFRVPVSAQQQNFIFAQPQMVHGGGSVGATHFVQAPQPQVHSQLRAGPSFGGPTPEPQNFMGFHPGSNIAFGSKPVPEPANNQGQDNYSSYAGYNVASSVSVKTNEQLNNNKEKQPQQVYSNAGENESVRYVSENVGKQSQQVYLNSGGNESVRNVSGSQQVYSNAGENESFRTANENVEETVTVEDNVDREIREEDEENEEVAVEEERDDSSVNNHGITFWTACPYCYYMYQYPQVYVDCAMRCQNCRMAFQAVVIPSPPPIVDGQDAYFCCWGFMPLGVSMDTYEKNKGSTSKAAYTRQKPSSPRVYIDEDDDIFVDISSSSESDTDWQDKGDRKRKSTAQNMRGRQASGMTPARRSKKVLAHKSTKGANNHATDGDVSKVGVKGFCVRKQPNRVSKGFNKLDLNVELSNEAEEAFVNLNKGNDLGQREDDIMEGIGFFEGLDELFNNLPIMEAA